MMDNGADSYQANSLAVPTQGSVVATPIIVLISQSQSNTPNATNKNLSL